MYKTINGWTKQKMIDHINCNFTIQSMDQRGDTCMYRGVSGAKCAIGLFIPDELYNVSMERQYLPFLIKLEPKLSFAMPLEQEAMSLLQNVHDRSSTNDVLLLMIEWIKDHVEE
jgi:hypothetical protein